MKNDKRAVGHIKKLDENKYLLRLSCGFDEFGKRIQPSKVVHCTSDTEAEKALMDFYTQRERLSQERRTGAPQTLAQLYHEMVHQPHRAELCHKNTLILRRPVAGLHSRQGARQAHGHHAKIHIQYPRPHRQAAHKKRRL